MTFDVDSVGVVSVSISVGVVSGTVGWIVVVPVGGDEVTSESC